MDEQQEKSTALSQNARPVPTWFFERQDGKIFACGEEEAWGILNNRNKTNFFKIIGQSDGKTYFDIIKNAKNEVVDLQIQKNQLTTDLAKYLETENDLRFKQLKDDDDEMVIKVVTKRNALQDKINEIDDQLSNFNKTIVTKAFEAELERARGNIVSPANQNIYTPIDKDRQTILNNFGIR